jgi:hypothetical protein
MFGLTNHVSLDENLTKQSHSLVPYNEENDDERKKTGGQHYTKANHGAKTDLFAGPFINDDICAAERSNRLLVKRRTLT